MGAPVQDRPVDKALAACSDLDRACLGTLAVLGAPHNRTQWAEYLRAADVREGRGAPAKKRGGKPSAGTVVGSTGLGKRVDRWLHAGLVRRSEHPHNAGEHFACPPEVAHALMLDPGLEDLRQRMEAYLRGEVNPRRFYHGRYSDDLVLARLALYRGDHEALRAHWSSALARRHGYGTDTEAVLSILPPHSPADAVARLPEDLQQEYLDIVLDAAFACGAMLSTEVLELAWQRGQGLTPSPLRALALALRAAHAPASGVDWEAEVERDACPAGLQAAAFASALRGEADAARRRAMAALEASRGRSGRKKPRLEGPLAPFCTLVLALADTEHQAAAKAQLAHVQKSRGSDAAPYLPVERLFEGLSPLPSAQSGPRPIHAPWPHLVRLLAGAFVQPGKHAWAARHATELADYCRGMRLHGLAEAADQLAARFSNGTSGDAELLRLGRLKQPWEIALEGLEATLPAPSQPAAATSDETGPAQRLAFFVELVQGGSLDDDDAWIGEYDDGLDPADEDGDPEELWSEDGSGGVAAHLAIEVKQQTRRKSGWTAGRNVAMSRLAEGGTNLEPSDADRRVLARIVTRRGYYGSREYSFSSRAPLALIGHPCVFWADDPKGPAVEVVRGQPSLVVEQRDGRFTMRVRPQVGAGGVGVLRDGEGRLVVYELSPLQESVQRLVTELPPIPAEGHARLSRVLDRLGREFTLQSSTGVQGLGQQSKEVAADTRPLVQLTRAEPGLRMTLRSAPLGPLGPTFAPLEGPRAVAASVEGELRRCERDPARENDALQRVLAAAPLLEGALVMGTLELQTLPECLELLRSLRELGEDEVWVRWSGGEPLEIVSELAPQALRLQIDEQNDWLAASGELQIDEERVLSLREALSLRTAGGRFVQLDDHRFLALGGELKEALDALQTAASVNKPRAKDRDALRIAPVALGFVRPWLAELSGLRTDRRVQERLAALDRALTQPLPVPRTLDAELRDYQRTGFEFMGRLCEIGAGALLADDMGLGKTLMSLAVLLHRAERGPALVVAPTSVRSNWHDEALRFAPTLELRAPNSLGDESSADPGPYDVVVVSYAMLAQRIETLERVPWATVVLDEAQAIKNHATQRAQAARRLVSDARIVLTGTPVENHLGDLYSLMSFLNPGLLGSAARFQERFARPIQREQDRRAASDLKALVGPFMLRRRKADVLRELPPRTEITLRVEPDEDERAFVEALRQDAVARLTQSGGDAQSPVTILAEITRLRRAACHPSLADPEAGLGVGSAKLDRLLSLVHELKEEGHRCLVFSQFVGFLELARQRLERDGLSYQYLDGRTPEAARARAVRAFQSGEGDAFLISLKAGGFGLNLTAADYVIHVDPWWNPAVEAQASDRAHRMGQTRPVTIYRLVNAGSIEERVLALHARKRQLAEDVLRDSDAPKDLDAQALMALLENT